jgi:hypothetical protein
MQTRVLAVAALAGIASVASAGSLVTTQNVSLWGSSYSVKSFSVGSDLGTGLQLQPESMVFYNGVLYVGGDRDTGETNGNLAAYNLGNVSVSPTSIAMGDALDNTTARKWGPEGMTVNTSGSGYGSFTSGGPKIVSVEGAGRRRAGVIDLGGSGNLVGDIVGNPPSTFLNIDDITFSSSADTFFGISGDGNGDVIYRLNKNDLSISSQFSLVSGGAKGMTTISAAFAQLLTGVAINTSQALLIAQKDGTGVAGKNRLAVYDLNGNLIGGEQGFNLAGLGLTSEIEAIAVDEATNRIWVGDETARQIHEFVIPTPASVSLLVGAALIAGRRRRA